MLIVESLTLPVGFIKFAFFYFLEVVGRLPIFPVLCLFFIDDEKTAMPPLLEYCEPPIAADLLTPGEFARCLYFMAFGPTNCEGSTYII